MNKAVIDRANRLVPLACKDKEVENENDDEVEDDWGSGGRELKTHDCGYRLYQSDRNLIFPISTKRLGNEIPV